MRKSTSQTEVSRCFTMSSQELEAENQWLESASLANVVCDPGTELNSIVMINKVGIRQLPVRILRRFCAKLKISGYKNQSRDSTIQLIAQRMIRNDIEKMLYPMADNDLSHQGHSHHGRTIQEAFNTHHQIRAAVLQRMLHPLMRCFLRLLSRIPSLSMKGGKQQKRRAQARLLHRLLRWAPPSKQLMCTSTKSTEMMFLALGQPHLCKSLMLDLHFEVRLFMTGCSSRTLIEPLHILVLLHLPIIHFCHLWASTIMLHRSLMCSRPRS